MLIDDKHQKLLGMPRDELVFMIQALRRIISMEQDEHRIERQAFQEFKLALKTVNVAVYCEVEDYQLAEEMIRIEEYLHDVDPDRVAAMMERLSEQAGPDGPKEIP